MVFYKIVKKKYAVEALLKLNTTNNPLKINDLPDDNFMLQAYLYHLQRIQYFKPNFSEEHWKLVDNLFQLSLHPYRQIRLLSQEKLCSTIAQNQLPANDLILKILSIWENIESPEYHILGCCHLLSSTIICYRLLSYWPLIKQFILTIFVAFKHDAELQKPVLNTIQSVANHLAVQLPSVSSSSPSNTSSSATQSDKEIYHELINHMSENAPFMPWKYQEKILYIIHQFLRCANEEPSLPLVHYLLVSLQSDIVVIRKTAVNCLTQLLYNIKISRPHHFVPTHEWNNTENIQNNYVNIVNNTSKTMVTENVIASSSIPNINVNQCDDSSFDNQVNDENWENVDFNDINHFGRNSRFSDKVKIYHKFHEFDYDKFKSFNKATCSYEDFVNDPDFCANKSEDLFFVRHILNDAFTTPQFWEIILKKWAHEPLEAPFSSAYAYFFQL